MKNAVWITWDQHRRTVELSRALSVRLVVIHPAMSGVLAYLYKSIITFRYVQKHRPEILFIQNPSVVLGYVASLLRWYFRYILIVDRHTNFRIGKKKGLNPLFLLYDYLSDFNIRHSDLHIVTNPYLKTFVDKKGGKGFVLPDRLPTISPVGRLIMTCPQNVVLICTYASDEPVREVIAAAARLPSSVCLYITGKPTKEYREIELPVNLILTGFLPHDEYDLLLSKADVIMDFTTLDWCIVCGVYEAIVLGKPLITSDTRALKDFLGDAVIYSNHTSQDIADKILFLLKHKDFYVERIKQYKLAYIPYWEDLFLLLQNTVEMMSRKR